MKLNFINQQFRMPDGGAGTGGAGAGAGGLLGGAAGMAFPPLGIAQGILGLGQAIFGGIRARKAQRELEKYPLGESITDYYKKALQRYNVQPSETSLYKRSQNSILRNQAAGLNALSDRRSALSGVNRLVGLSNDASLNADVAAENERNQRFGELGRASQMEANARRDKYNLLMAKASGGNQIMNAGLSNIFGSFQTGQQYNQLNQIYGG